MFPDVLVGFMLHQLYVYQIINKVVDLSDNFTIAYFPNS